MTIMSEDEKERLIEANPHLKKYLEEIQDKMSEPVFYSKVPRDVKEEEYPNIIYPTKGVVFIHIYRIKGAEETEYYCIEPTLSEEEKEKREKIMEMIYERAPYKKKINTDEEIKNAIREFLDEITVVDKKGGEKSKNI